MTKQKGITSLISEKSQRKIFAVSGISNFEITEESDALASAAEMKSNSVHTLKRDV